MKDACPSRFQVARTGSPDPDSSQYYVLDVVHDFAARAALRRLVRSYRMAGASMKADELEEFLDSTTQAHADVVRARSTEMNKRKR